MDGAHLLATQFIQEISTCLAENLVRDCLNFGAAIGVQRQKRTSIKINSVDRPSVRGQKNGLLPERPLDCVAIRAFSQGCDRYESPTREVRLNEVSTMLWRTQGAADREP